MIKRRINNDYVVEWSIIKGADQPVNLEGRTLVLEVQDEMGNSISPEFTINTNKIKFLFGANFQKRIGIYTLILIDNTTGVRRTLDIAKAFELVLYSYQEDLYENNVIELSSIISMGVKGDKGDRSIYEESDHKQAVDDHIQASSDHTQAVNDNALAAADHSQAVSDHVLAENDHEQSVSDHTQAASDHSQAVNDHFLAENDHTQATTDHSQAVNDHVLAENDHERAENDHAKADEQREEEKSIFEAKEAERDSEFASKEAARDADVAIIAQESDKLELLQDNFDNLQKKVYAKTIIIDGHKAIDLGIRTESGKRLLWAEQNVGAETTGGYGLLFQFGRTDGYAYGSKVVTTDPTLDSSWGHGLVVCDESTLKTTSGTVYDKNKTLILEDDAAHANMGGRWRMPNAYEIEELSKLNSEWTTINGIYGRKITANGIYIFLPATGFFYGFTNGFSDKNVSASYFSAQQNEFNSHPSALNIKENSFSFYWSTMITGNPIRGVIEVSDEELDVIFYTKDEVDKKIATVEDITQKLIFNEDGTVTWRNVY